MVAQLNKKAYDELKAKLDLLNQDKLINGWLSEFNKETTKAKYLQRIAKFLDDMKTTPSALKAMDVAEIKKLVLEYQSKGKQAGLKNNGILSNITAVRSFSGYLNKPLKFRRSQLVSLETDTEAHVFSNGDLKLLFDVGDTFEKALIATAVSEGWEISSFLEQERDLVEKRLAHAKQNGEKFIFFEQTREKTGVLRFCVLNPLAIEWISNYLSIRKDSDPRLFPITSDGVQKMVYRLAENSGLKVTGSLRFHKIRAWLMSRLSRAGFGEFQIKFVIGHSIPLTDRTYLNTLKEEITEKYPRLYNDYLNISPVIGAKETNKQLEELTKKIEAKDRIVDALVQDSNRKELAFEVFKQEMAVVIAPLLTIVEKQLGIYTRSRALHTEMVPKLEAKGSPLAKEARESEQYLTLEADKLEKELALAKQILNKK